MEDTDLHELMARLERLISRVEQLKSQNGLLLAQEKTWREERAHLIEKNEIARNKVESMISRLKALEQENNQLKRLLADAHLDIAALKDVVQRKW